MTVTGADLSQWAIHRRAVVFTVSRRVPGVDPELAASRGLEVLRVELLRQRDISDPAAFWCAASVEAALELARAEPLPGDEAAHAEAVTAPVGHVPDFEVLHTALERLPTGEQQLLWDHHVASRPVAAIADEIGVLPYAAKRRLRRAENRLASSVADTHADAAEDAECRSSRASMHDFVRNRLLPHRRQEVEDHLVQCAGCTRAFVDVRESYWMLRSAAPVLLVGAVVSGEAGAAGAVGMGAAGVGTAGVGAGATGAGATGVGSGLAALGTRAVLTARSALTDPAGLVATVAGGLFITTAVTTGVAGDAGAVQPHIETGTVSVVAPESAPVARDIVPRSPAEDPANVPEPTLLVPSDGPTTDATPPGLAKKDGVPPGQGKKHDVPPAKGTGVTGETTEPGTKVPPGLAKKDGVPPGQAKKESTPPGLAKKDGVPPGQAKKDGVPPGQAKKDGDAPGQTKDVPGQTKDVPPGQAKKDDVPPGQAKKDPSPKKRQRTASGQARSRSTSTS